MDKATLEKMATQAFSNLNTSRAALFAAAEKAIYFSMNLDADKATLLQSGRIDGKNAEIRARFDFDQAQYEVDTVKTLLRIAELPE